MIAMTTSSSISVKPGRRWWPAETFINRIPPRSRRAMTGGVFFSAGLSIMERLVRDGETIMMPSA